ncbi:MAG: hypothetical protein IT578_04565 [Verrucomicrobiae bacterium]|nr:hypothetical protein [Verrucomicrobiae bacterium]
MDRRLVREAEEHLERGEYRPALLCARRVLQRQPPRADACRVMAILAEKMGVSAAVQWRKQVFALEPRNSRNRADLVLTALRFGDLKTADAALKTAEEADRKTAVFQELAALLALRSGLRDRAERHYAEACRLAPSDDRLRLNWAIAKWNTGKAPEVQEARRHLRDLAAHSTLRLPALRALYADAVRAKDWNEALACAERLQAEADASFRDRLLGLSALRHADPAGFPARLRELQDGAQTPSEIAELLGWMNEQGLVQPARAWAAALPPERCRQAPVPLALANLNVKSGDWRALEASLSRQNWVRLEFLRRAFLARALREQGAAAEAAIYWRSAMQGVTRNPRFQMTLLKLVESWGWDAEAEGLLWQIAKEEVAPRWALHQLFLRYRHRGETQGMLQVTERLLHLDPHDTDVRNNAIMFTLLLRGKDAKAIAAAQRLYASNPTNAVFATTHALALHLLDMDRVAAHTLEEFDAATLRVPSVAAYYGLVLASVNPSLSRKYLKLAAAARLLPEEKALLAAAAHRARVASPP